jgi:hypothetical protein
VGALKDFCSHLAASIKADLQQRDGLSQQRRERFLSIHNSPTAPSELLVLPPRRLPELQFLGNAFMVLLSFLYFCVVTVPACLIIISSFRSINAREVEVHQWVRGITSKTPTNARDAQYQQAAKDIGELETSTASVSRWTTATAAIFVVPFALLTLIGPLFWTRYLLRTRHLLRYGLVAHAEVMSRKSRTPSARLSFVTAAGEQVSVIHDVPVYVPIGAKLWALYSPQNPRCTLVWHPSRELAKLLPRATTRQL